MDSTQEKYNKNRDYRAGYRQCSKDIKDLINSLKQESGIDVTTLNTLSSIITMLRFKRTSDAEFYWGKKAGVY